MKKLHSLMFLFSFLLTISLTNVSFAAHPCIMGQPCIDHSPISTGIECTMFPENLKYKDGIKNVDLKVVRLDKNAKIVKVIELQEALKNAGHLKSEPTGYFGPATLRAVKEYQKNNNISPTGYAGVKTRAALKKQFCNNGKVSEFVEDL